MTVAGKVSQPHSSDTLAWRRSMEMEKLSGHRVDNLG